MGILYSSYSIKLSFMKILKIILFSLLSLWLFHTTYAASITNIKVVDDKHVDLNFSWDINLWNGPVNGDIKVLKNINITFASKDFNDSNKVTLTLWEDLSPNTNYTLISIFGVDGSIDFKTDSILENSEKINSDVINGQGITRLVISDPRVIELYFRQPIAEEVFEFKLLNEIKTESIVSINPMSLTITMMDSLQINSEYMTMIISLKNSLWSEVLLDESFLDFTTHADLVSTKVAETILQADAAVVEETQGNLEEVALNSAVTSETGAATWVLLLLTFLVSIFFFIAQKISKA